MKTNLVLIGYRGCGKSFLAEKVSKKLNLKLFSSDKEIENKIGTTVKSFVEFEGWDKFREIEKQVVGECLNLEYHLFDFGGGVIHHTELLDEFKKTSTFCYIDVTIAELHARLSKDKNRPVLKGHLPLREEIQHTLALRRPLYQKYADFTIENSGGLDTAQKAIDDLVYHYKRHL